jgi:phosphatidylethanolamine/phosphatidyl-N-methylethanolamine N-methyltransferase
MSKRTFISQFFKRGNKVGAIAPSSRFLAAKMLHHVPFESCKTIVEFGPGTGAFTKLIQTKMQADAKLLIIELNEAFCSELRDKFENDSTEVIHGSATELKKILAERNLSEADCIISSLPLAIFNETLRNNILCESQNSLKTGGYFIQFQYSLQSKKALQKHFSQLKVDFTPLNIPPAFIYTCKK